MIPRICQQQHCLRLTAVRRNSSQHSCASGAWIRQGHTFLVMLSGTTWPMASSRSTNMFFPIPLSLAVCLTVCLSISLSVCLSLSLCLSLCLSLYLSIYLSISPLSSLSLSLSLSVLCCHFARPRGLQRFEDKDGNPLPKYIPKELSPLTRHTPPGCFPTVS